MLLFNNKILTFYFFVIEAYYTYFCNFFRKTFLKNVTKHNYSL